MTGNGPNPIIRKGACFYETHDGRTRHIEVIDAIGHQNGIPTYAVLLEGVDRGTMNEMRLLGLALLRYSER